MRFGGGTTALRLRCPLALRWVTLGIEFHRSGSAGATGETCELASLSGGWTQLKADADAPTPVPLAPSVIRVLSQPRVTLPYLR